MKFTKEVRVEIEPHEIGVKLANTDNEYQASVLDTLAKEFIAMGDFKEGMQMAFVNDCLSETARAFILKLAGYIK